jgi:hypothetical protein
MRAWWARKLGSLSSILAWFWKVAFLHRLDRIHLQVGPADGQHDAGQAAAGAHVHQPGDAGQVRQHRQGIEQVVGEHRPSSRMAVRL